jgi:hypothetical protein
MMLNVLTLLIKILFEMLRQFVLLLFGQRGDSAGVVAFDEFFFAMFLKVFEIGSDAAFGDEEDFGDFGWSPTTAEENDRIDAVRLVFPLERFMKLS